MSCWDGPYPEQPEDETEGKWEDPEDADESWRGDQHLDDWPEPPKPSEYWMNWDGWFEDGREGQ